MPTVHDRVPALLLALAGATLLNASGCSSRPSPEESPSRSAAPRSSLAPAGVAGQGARAVALVGDQTISFDDLRAALAELGGAVALEELALDIMLDREIAARTLQIGSADIANEQRLLEETLSDEAGAAPAQTTQMLGRLQAARGLGHARFPALLARNAKLRALIRDDVQVTSDLVAREQALLTGPRLRVRLLVLPTQAAASAARTAILASPVGDARSARFAALATQQSIDASAAAGGLIPSVSPQDPALPSVVRTTLTNLAQGEVSDVLALSEGFGLLLHESSAPPAGPPQDPARVERRVRTRLERFAMEALSQQLLRRAGVRVLDANLAWSWDQRERAQ